MQQPYGYIYFIFAGYRAAIGKTTNLYRRRTAYRRTHFEIQILGLIPCQSKVELNTKENQILNRFQSSNAFRDMFYLTQEMRDWIIENTEPFTQEIETAITKEVSRDNAKLWRNPEYRQKQRERKQRYKGRSYKTDTLKIPGL